MARQQGRATVDQLIAVGRIEAVPPDLAGAENLVAKARTHLRSAVMLADSDVELAYDALHAANRKALTAVLLAQGLRPTRAAGHTGVHEAVRAQLDPPLGAVLAPYTRVRRARNAGDYLDELPAQADDVLADRVLCEAIVDVAARVIGRMPTY
jgi:hypothetical protein